MKIMKKLYSLLGSLGIVFIAIVILIFWKISSNIKQQNAEWERQRVQACENAQNYISEKYGFQAEIISTEQDWRNGIYHIQKLSDYLIKMQYQDKIFDVSINGRNANTNGYDSYQTEDILNSVRQECEKSVSDVYRIGVNHGESALERLESEALFSTYFDGSNAPELLQKSQIFVQYVQTDLSVMKNHLNFRRFQNILFVSFRSEELLQNCSEFLYQIGFYDKCAVYFDNVYQFCNKEENYYQYEIGQCGNIYYYVPDGNLENVTVSEIEQDDISNWKKYRFPKTPASKTWKIKVKQEADVIVFVPKSEISGSGIHCAIRENNSYTDKYLGDMENFIGIYLTQRFHIRPDEEFHFLYLKS